MAFSRKHKYADQDGPIYQPPERVPVLDGIHSPANISIYAALLGFASGAGLVWGLVSGGPFRAIGFFISALSTFHTLEYICTAIYKREGLGLNSFLLNHSKEYHFAMSFGLFEFFIELWLFPTMKSFGIFKWIALAIVVASQILRSSAMITAGANFTHIVADRQEQSHRLVIHGVYKFFRHPSYTGFFYWAIGLQLMMGNPIAAVGYMIALYKFFSNRITYEERTLVSFFGDDYVAYKKNTKTYIPFIP